MIDLGLEIYHTIGECADRMGLEAYAVGGVVRDFFLGRPCTDIDVVCCRVESGELADADEESHLSPPSIGIELARAVDEAVGGGKVSVFRNFGTASFKWHDYQIEFVGARRESYHRESRKPVVEDGTLQDDQCRRDFTVNALAVCLNAERYGELVDPFGGIRDMDAGLLRTPLDPDITFSDDPLRMMRAVRFASQLGFRIDDPTFEAIGRNAERLKIVSAERIAVEINKIMMSPRPSVGLKLMQKSGLMQLVLPEVAALQGVETIDGRGHKDIFYHTMEVVDNVVEGERLKVKDETADAVEGER